MRLALVGGRFVLRSSASFADSSQRFAGASREPLNPRIPHVRSAQVSSRPAFYLHVQLLIYSVESPNLLVVLSGVAANRLLISDD